MIGLILVLSSWFHCAIAPASATQSDKVRHRVADKVTIAVRTNADSATVDPLDLISYAQSLKGIRYKYASADPDKGFDCSGFVLYVFKHFHVNVPRSSSAFSKIGRKVALDDARPGDIILFTGPNSKTAGSVGHVGIITSSGPTLSFIHATSGKAYSVIETSMSPHYRKRFVKLVRVL